MPDSETHTAPETKDWRYLDLPQQIQGDFTTSQMRLWWKNRIIKDSRMISFRNSNFKSLATWKEEGHPRDSERTTSMVRAPVRGSTVCEGSLMEDL
jgi:hypothetical protein